MFHTPVSQDRLPPSQLLSAPGLFPWAENTHTANRRLDRTATMTWVALLKEDSACVTSIWSTSFCSCVARRSAPAAPACSALSFSVRQLRYPQPLHTIERVWVRCVCLYDTFQVGNLNLNLQNLTFYFQCLRAYIACASSALLDGFVSRQLGYKINSIHSPMIRPVANSASSFLASVLDLRPALALMWISLLSLKTFKIKNSWVNVTILWQQFHEYKKELSAFLDFEPHLTISQCAIYVRRLFNHIPHSSLAQQSPLVLGSHKSTVWASLR